MAPAFMLAIPLMIFVIVAFQVMAALPWSSSSGLTDTAMVPIASAAFTADANMNLGVNTAHIRLVQEPAICRESQRSA